MAGRKFIDLTGRKFTRLTVVERIKIGAKHKWACDCRCGRRVNINTEQLVAGRRKSCGCIRHTDVEVGNRYGKLTVTKYLPRGGKRPITVECLCDCGNMCNVQTRYIQRKSATHCGCDNPKTLPAKQKPEMPQLINKVLSSYVSNAKKKGREFALSLEYFTYLITSKCYYCGQPPSNIKSLRGIELLWNGIDRKQNTLGYIVGNVVPCCTECNYMKCERDHDEFIERIILIGKNIFISKVLDTKVDS